MECPYDTQAGDFFDINLDITKPWGTRNKYFKKNQVYCPYP